MTCYIFSPTKQFIMYSTKPVYEWYAVYTRVHHEKKIFQLLQEKNIESYLPLIKTMKQWSDRKKWIEEPLFKCYLFVKVSYLEYFKVQNIPGVVNYVCFGGIPQKIPETQIENIKTLISQKREDIVITRENIMEGLKAEVIFGPLKGLKGEVVQICGQSNILIRLRAMNCCLYIKISKDEIKVLKSAEANNEQTVSKKVLKSCK